MAPVNVKETPTGMKCRKGRSKKYALPACLFDWLFRGVAGENTLLLCLFRIPQARLAGKFVKSPSSCLLRTEGVTR